MLNLKIQRINKITKKNYEEKWIEILGADPKTKNQEKIHKDKLGRNKDPINQAQKKLKLRSNTKEVNHILILTKSKCLKKIQKVFIVRHVNRCLIA